MDKIGGHYDKSDKLVRETKPHHNYLGVGDQEEYLEATLGKNFEIPHLNQ
jgi:hypothetical protein